MKSKLLFLTMMLLGLTSVSGTTAGDAVLNGEDLKNTRYRYAQSISFVERGVEFLIFSDGSFDFNTEVFSERRNKRVNNRTYNTRSINYTNRTRGVIITHDRFGRVNRIGNIFISYNKQGKIKRAGSVYINYRGGQLKQVGGLHVLYNRRGQITGSRGYVNSNNKGSRIYRESRSSNQFDNRSQNNYRNGRIKNNR